MLPQPIISTAATTHPIILQFGFGCHEKAFLVRALVLLLEVPFMDLLMRLF
jgi:hypothetical protein